MTPDTPNPAASPARDAKAPAFRALAIAAGVAFAGLFAVVVAREIGAPGPVASWAIVFMVLAVAFGAVGVLMGVARPESVTARHGFYAALLVAAYMLGLIVRPVPGVRPDLLSVVLGSVFPLHIVLAFAFLERFPVPVARGPRRRMLGALVVVAGLAVWALRCAYNAWLGGFLPGAAWLDAWGGTPRLTVELIYAAGAIAAAFDALAHNYRALPEGNDRRRIRLVVLGIALPVVPGVLTSLVVGVIVALGLSEPWRDTLRAVTLAANAAFVVVPVTLGYAILKHRVLGIRLVVRLGLQYVLARNTLRLLIALPVVWFATQMFANRDRSLSELLVSGTTGVNLAMLGLGATALRFRTRIGGAIDRRFFREAYDQEQLLIRLVEALKRPDAIENHARVACREIDAALHLHRVIVMARPRTSGQFGVAHATDDAARGLVVSLDHPLVTRVARQPAGTAASELRAQGWSDTDWIGRLRVDLTLPVAGAEADPVGLLLLGEKRSEEPFTVKDRNLLQMVAGQLASAFEMGALRDTVDRQQRVAAEVLGRLDEDAVNLVKECPECGRCYDRTAERCADDGATLDFSLASERVVDGKYRLDRVLGRGGMGAVYEAADQRLGRTVAVKIVQGGFGSEGAELRRFAREAQATARLEHPNIVRVYDYGSIGGDLAYLVMEHLQGETWRAMLVRDPMPPPALLADLFDQVLSGLEAAHATGVLHRDLKPENLFLVAGAERPRVKILDFGLAKIREGQFTDPKSRTSTGASMGTFGYMAPEQLLGNDVDERADVYAAGVVALESLTGPLNTRGEFFHFAIDAALRERLLGPEVVAARRAAGRVLERALAQAPADRHPTAAALRAELVPALRACAAPATG